MRIVFVALFTIIIGDSSIAGSEAVNSLNLGGPYFHAGSQAVEAYPHWERSFLGPIPTVIGATRYATLGTNQPALKIIAIISQDATAHSLLIAENEHNAIAADPKGKLPGQKGLLTRASSAEMFAAKCLDGWRTRLDQLNIIPAEQAEIRTAFAEKAANVAFAWTPFVGLIEKDSAKGKPLQCLNMQDFDAPAFIVARADLLEDTNPTTLANNRAKLAEFVAKALGAWAKAESNPREAAERLIRSYEEEDIIITRAQAEAELNARRPPDLEGQRLAFKAPTGDVAPLAKTMDKFMDFMISTGTLKASMRPTASSLIEPSILELIANTPDLAAKAKGN